MTPEIFILPLFAHVLLVYVVMGLMGRARTQAVRSGKVKMADVVIDNFRWPDDARKIGNNYQNQFELPVLFYAVMLLDLQFGRADVLAFVLACLFVVLRVGHMRVHTGANVVLDRFRLFLASGMVLGAMWGWLAIKLYEIA